MFEAEEAAEAFKKRELERAKEVAQEREREEHRRLISTHKNAWEDDKGHVTNKGGALSFMYEPPPGLVSQIGGDGEHGGGGGRTGGQSVRDDGRDGNKDVEQGSGFNPNTINPLGLEIRNVRCIKCKAWGHQMGDDECPLRNKSVEAELFRQQIEDPVMLFMDRSAGSKVGTSPSMLSLMLLIDCSAGHCANLCSDYILRCIILHSPSLHWPASTNFMRNVLFGPADVMLFNRDMLCSIPAQKRLIRIL